MGAVAGSAAIEVAKCAWNPLKKHMDYLIHFNDNVKDLKDRVQDLVARKEHIDRLVSTGCSNGEEETPEVKLWLTRTAEMKQAAATIQQKVAENKGCLHCLNLKWRYNISKQAKQMTECIVRYYDDGNPEKMKMTVPSSLPTVIMEEAPSIQGLPSVESSLQEVMSALRDENTKIIGVWGMGGVGKTTLVKNVNNKLQGTQEFKKVIMVTVSKDVDIKKIQGDIAKRLDVTLKDDTESSRASKLRSSLMKEEAFLIILDDLWERLDLAAVGIPSPTSHTGCKIIFTTRSKNVCNRMESKVNVLVNVLSEKESEKLFKEKAGDVVDDPSLRTKAREVFKECAGLPLAIVTLGRALRGERDPRVWEVAVSQMRMSAPGDIEDMEKAVYQSIKISYERLQDMLKPLFLFCCLFPEDYDIHVDRMIHMWKGEGFLDDLESLEVAINIGHTWVEKLKSSCLLLAGEKEGYVKMHNIVRNVAIRISSEERKDCKSFVRIGLKGLPQGKSWEEYKRISLWRCGINRLPEGMHCPKLLTLMMPENEEPIEIQGWFWQATKDLRVLDLSSTAISKIPLSNLVNLRVLCLRSCRFEKGNCLSALGGLKQLEFLDLSFNDWLRELPNEIGELFNLRVLCLRSCKFEGGNCLSALGGLKQLEVLDLSFNDWLCELPKEIGELVNLRSLDLTNTVNLKIVPSGVISRLTLLEELKMWNSFREWKAEEKDASSSSSSSNASLSEVASLKELSNLHPCIVEVERLPRDYPLFKHPTKLKIFCFCKCPRPDYGRVHHAYPESYSDELRYMEIVGCSLIPEWALMPLPQTTHLKLIHCNGQGVLYRSEGFPSLKYLKVLDLSETAMISKIPVPSNLVNLRVLCLSNCMFKEGNNYLSGLGRLKQLEFLDLSFNNWLCELPNEIGELVNLRSLDLTNTINLKIVPSGVISRLTLLEELKMWNSFHEWKAEEKDASSSSSNASLSEVASLKELSNLRLFIVEVERFPRDYPLIKHPTKLKKFCFCICPRPDHGGVYRVYPESNPDELRFMEIVGCSLIPEWALMLLPQTTHLKLEECKGQEALNRGGGFPSLKSLTVEKCDDVEFVVSAKESPENAFGNLQSLVLGYLPHLKKVVTKYEEGLLPTTLLFHNLEKVEVYVCPQLKHLLPSILLQGMDNLTYVTVSYCGGMERLFDGPPKVEQRNDVLSKLRSLRLFNLRSMTSIWPMGLVVKLQQLATLVLKVCPGLKKSVVSAKQMKGGLPNLAKLIVGFCGGVEEIISDVVDNEGLLPKLENLTLCFLPELVRIYGGGEAVPPPQLDWHSLETIYVNGCPKLKKVQPLQGGADSVPSLKEIKGERNWLKGLDWEGDDRVISQFHPLFEEVLQDDEDEISKILRYPLY